MKLQEEHNLVIREAERMSSSLGEPAEQPAKKSDSLYGIINKVHVHVQYYMYVNVYVCPVFYVLLFLQSSK